jgi:IS30 family transposase
MPGHWEGALIMGANNRSAVGTLVERTIRLVLLAKLDGTTATAAATGFSDKLNEIPRSLRLSMTYDQGREMVKHTEITQRTGTAIYLQTRTACGSAAPTRIPAMAVPAEGY